jgi:hypothetical protein
MESEMHEAGTVAGCPTCRQFVYEPGWYQMLRRLSEPERDQEVVLSLVCGSSPVANSETVPVPTPLALTDPHPVSALGF